MSYLIIGGTLNQQKEKIRQIAQSKNISLESNNPDLLQIEPENSIGIDQIRQIKSFLSKKSWQGQTTKTVIIYQTEAMTTPAQNAFLKTVEEPPPNSEIIITASNKNALLPTILSRCHILRLATNNKRNQEELNEYWKQWQKLTQANIDKKLTIASKIKKEDLKKYIQALHQKIIESKQGKAEIKTWLENLITAKQMVEDNVNLRHAVDWLALKL